MKDINILISGVGSMVAASIIKNYKLVNERKIKIIGIDIKDEVATINLLDKFYKVPKPEDEKYPGCLLNICKTENIDFVVPLVDNELPVISKDIKLFEELGIKVCINDYEKINLMTNKHCLYNYLESNNILVPKNKLVKTYTDFVESCKYLGYPEEVICFKPLVSSGSRGFRIINDNIDEINMIFKEKPNSKYINYKYIDEVLSTNNNFPEFIMMEYVSGELYNVNVLADEGKIIYIVSGKVIDFELGNTMKCIIEEKNDIKEYCEKIVKLLNLSGNIGFEVAYDKYDKLKLIEINPRIQGQIISSTAAGVNFPYLELKMRLGESLPKINIKNDTEMIRYWGETFFYNGKAFHLENNIE